MEVVNVHELPVEHDVGDPPGYRGGGERLGPRIGASASRIRVYD